DILSSFSQREMIVRRHLCYYSALMSESADLGHLNRLYEQSLRSDHLRFQADMDRIQLQGVVLRQGDNLKDGLKLLNLRKGRAESLTKRLHMVFCALAAARVHRPEGWVSIEEIGQLEGWSGGGSVAVAKLLVNEFELGPSHLGI